MKKGFTLSETMISLVVIGVIAAIILPILNSIRPDNGRVLYKKAMYSMQNAISTALNDSTSNASNAKAFWAGDDVTAGEFCASIAETMSIIGDSNCGTVGSYSNPNFKTINGSTWWGLGDASDADKFTLGTGTHPSKTIYVDVDGANGENTLGKDQFKLKVRYDGRVTTGTTTSTDPTSENNWDAENDYLSDALKIKK